MRPTVGARLRAKGFATKVAPTVERKRGRRRGRCRPDSCRGRCCRPSRRSSRGRGSAASRSASAVPTPCGSPTISQRALRSPTPNTVHCRLACRLQRVQAATSSASRCQSPATAALPCAGAGAAACAAATPDAPASTLASLAGGCGMCLATCGAAASGLRCRQAVTPSAASQASRPAISRDLPGPRRARCGAVRDGSAAAATSQARRAHRRRT